MLEPKIYSVSQINRYIKKLFENDFILNSVWVKGEISNLKFHSSGHVFFTLKDANSSINCIMFKGSADILPFLPENGMSVVICGYVSLYEKSGQYQLYAELMDPLGLGSLSMAYEQLKEKLSQEGIFDEDYKRDICKFPKCIAVITSPTGAAVRDIINITKRRNRFVKIVVVPALVQGEKAANSIVAAIKTVNNWKKADTIILGRGGGSIEDLWPFNEEKVVRAVFASDIPVISAVGHETDYTLVDFVSDLRAPTPSAAAELAVNDLSETERNINMVLERLISVINSKISYEKKRFDFLVNRPVLNRPYDFIINNQIYLDNLERRLKNKVEIKIKTYEGLFSGLVGRLEALSPLALLKRGYVAAQDSDGKIITSIEDVNIGDTITLNMKDGLLKTKVESRVKAYGKEENSI